MSWHDLFELHSSAVTGVTCMSVSTAVEQSVLDVA
jgi:hypothetical protein